MKLYSYWRSGTAHRTRIALNLKGLDYDLQPVDLRAGEHKTGSFLAKNPQGLVPALELDDGIILTQSPAIIEYLEEAYPALPLLPSNKLAKAQIRAMAAVIGCDTHPLNNLRVLKYQKQHYEAGDKEIARWTANWIGAAFSALEQLLASHSSASHSSDSVFAHGNQPGLFECYLIPQIYSARRFKTNLAPYPRLVAIDKACHELEAFLKAQPENQPDAD
jgi:maleylacetoacetate isomerase